MEDLKVWLRTQLDEDERIARGVEDRSAPWDGQWMADGNSAVRTVNGHVLFYRHGPDPLKPGLTDHVAEHDPARVLRELDAKRRFLDSLLPDLEQADRCIEGEWGSSDDLTERTLRLLALPYAHRPGYRSEWADTL
ncbi:DUF6221 family protein [Streptomyces sp. NPDC002784]